MYWCVSLQTASTKMLAYCLCLVLFFSTSIALGQDCSCPDICPQTSCKSEALKVRDECDCCDICLGLEGMACGGSTNTHCALPEDKYGFSCIKSHNDNTGTGVCQCKHPKKGPFCGQDGVTYKTKCDLRFASWIRQQRNSSLIGVAYHGECEELPRLTRAPGNVNNRTGEKAYLACEAYGIPTPHIAFRKIIRNENDEDIYEEMPSDRLNMAVQIRGGPDKHKISAWVLVDPLTEDDAGWYECLASNTQGSVSEKGYVEIIH